MKKRNRTISLLLIMVMLFCDCMPVAASDSTEEETPVVHTWADPVFEWDGYEVCKGTFTCTTCEGEAAHEEVVGAVITKKTQDPTCDEEGKITYTAKCRFEKKTYKETKVEAIEATGHGYEDDVCTECGNERKPASIVTMPESRTVVYNGKVRNFPVTKVEGSTGKVTYQFFVDEYYTDLTTKDNSGANKEGGWPKDPGVYYVMVTVAGDDNYRKTVYAPAKLTINPRAVKTLKAENKVNGVKLTWSKCDEADGYIIYRKYSNGKYQEVKTITKNTTLSYLDKSVAASGGKYSYNIVSYKKAEDETKVLSEKRSSAAAILTMLPQITNVEKGAKLQWKLSGDSSVKGFYVYRKKGTESKYKKIATINKKKSTYTWTDKNCVNGEKAIYYIEAYYSKSNSTVKKSAAVTNYFLSAPEPYVSGDYIVWERNEKADGYVEYSYNYYFGAQSIDVIESNKTTKIKRSSSTRFQDEQYVRAYKIVGNVVYYSEWGMCYDVSF